MNHRSAVDPTPHINVALRKVKNLRSPQEVNSRIRTILSAIFMQFWTKLVQIYICIPVGCLPAFKKLKVC